MRKIFLFIIIVISLLSEANVLAADSEDTYIVKYKTDSVMLCSDDLQLIPYTDDLYLADSETAALVKGKDSYISFDSICEYLKMSAKDCGADGYDEYYGWGVLNPKVFVDNILGRTKVYMSSPNVSYDEISQTLTLKSNILNKSGSDVSCINTRQNVG